MTLQHNRAEALLDYAGVQRYWSQAQPSILGPYMMDGFGFPAGAGRFRFRAECRIVERLIRRVNRGGVALDLGCGIGFWTEYFAQSFGKVIGVEASVPLYQAMSQRCRAYENVTPVHGDVLSFEPEDRYELIFLGGMLMYLNESDVVSLLRKVIPYLAPGGMILCRESTVRNGIVVREGNYQAVYRSVQAYRDIFGTCDVSVEHVETNVPYILMQMGCETVKRWQAVVPRRLQFTPFVGHLVSWAVRLGNPWLTRIPEILGLEFPELTNHFFLLRPDSRSRAVIA